MNGPFRRIRQYYMDLKLQSKFTLVMLLLVLLPAILIAYLLLGNIYNMVVSYTIQQEQDSSAQTAPLIEERIQDVMDTASEISSSSFYAALFHQPVNKPLSVYAASGKAAEFRQTVDALLDSGRATGIRIYVEWANENSELFSHENTEGIFFPGSAASGTYWHGIFDGDSTLTELFCPSIYLGPTEREECGDIAYIQKGSLYYHGKTCSVYLAVYFSSSELIEILSDNLSMDGSVSYIINERDALVASSDSALSGIYWLSYDTIEASFMSSNNFIERDILDETVYAGYYNISQPGWFMVTILPSQPLIARGNRLTLMFLGIYLITALLAFILAVSLSRSITGRLSSVVNQMQTVRQGPPVPMESPVVHDEVGDLIDTYNFMTRRMNHLLRQQSRNAEELRIAEFNSLQAQINPHFLYNTMDMINWMALQGRTSEVSDAIQKLSRFYKLTLSQKSSIVSIASEIEHVSIYADLQNMRFHDAITLITDIPDELTRFQMPKLTLQPVVENAILHGILEKDSKAGTIVLTGWMEMDDIVLLVSDDGIGIPPEKLANILTGTGNSSSGGTNIGVFNTHRRLQILYGTNYGLSYSSTPGKGTDVEIRIPAQREYQNHLAAGRIGSSGNPLPLVTVTNRITEGREGELITPQQMVSYSRQVAANRYKLGNLHQISPKLSPRETLYILSHEVNEKYPAHSHDYYELNYLCSGTIINTIDGNPVYMSAGDLIFLNREAVHSLECVKPEALLVNFCLKPEAFERTLRSFTESRNLISDFIRGEGREKQNFIFFPLGHSLQAQTYLASIIEEYANNGFSQSFALEGLFLLLFNYLAASNEFSYRGIDSQTWQMVKYLEENCLKLNVDKIAAKFNMTKEQFDAHLKEHTGRSAADLINEERLEHAAALLASHNISIYQISESCGFKDVEEFTRDFQKKFHVSPSEYRNQFW